MLPNEILKEASIQGILQNQQSLEVEVVREKSADSRYLGRLFRLSFSVIGLEGQRVSGITGFSVPLVLRISGEKILDPANVRGITLETPRGRLLASHYEANSGMIHLLLPEVTRQIGLVRAFNRNERIFTEETGLVRQGGQAYLPLRIVATEFGWDVVWNPFTRMVNLTKGDKTLVVDEFIIVRERSFVTASFLAKQLEIPVFVFDREVVLKKY